MAQALASREAGPERCISPPPSRNRRRLHLGPYCEDIPQSSYCGDKKLPSHAKVRYSVKEGLEAIVVKVGLANLRAKSCHSALLWPTPPNSALSYILGICFLYRMVLLAAFLPRTRWRPRFSQRSRAIVARQEIVVTSRHHSHPAGVTPCAALRKPIAIGQRRRTLDCSHVRVAIAPIARNRPLARYAFDCELCELHLWCRAARGWPEAAS